MTIANIQFSVNNGPWLDLDQTAFPLFMTRMMHPFRRYDHLKFREKDAAGNIGAASAEMDAAAMDATPPPAVSIHVDCGGGAILGWQNYEDDSTNSYHGGTGTATGPISGGPTTLYPLEPAPQVVGGSFRYAGANGNFTYTFPVVANKEYRVRLHWPVNFYFGWTGSKPMAVTINGGTPISIDPFVDAGSPSGSTGWLREFVVQQGASTSLTVNLSASGGNAPFLGGIECCSIPGIRILTPALPDGKPTVSYSRTLVARDAIGAVTWALIGTLPAGLSLNTSTGVISGTPTTDGTSIFFIKLTDSTARSVTKLFMLHVQSAPSPYILDSLSAAPQYAFSIRKLRSAYSGQCCKAIRITDEVTQDIPFNSCGVLDTAALIDFSGGNPIVIYTWYDQMGNINATGDISIPRTSVGFAPAYSHLGNGIRPGMAVSEQIQPYPQLAIRSPSATTGPMVFVAGHFKYDPRPVPNHFFMNLGFRAWLQDGGVVLHTNADAYGCKTTSYLGAVDQITFVFKSGGYGAFINGTFYPVLATALNTTTPNTTSDANDIYIFSGGSPAFGDTLEGVAGEFIYWLSASGVSNVDRDALMADQQSYFQGGVTPNTDHSKITHHIRLEGDSLTYGFPSGFDLGHAITAQGPTGEWKLSNLATSGQQLLFEMASDAAVQLDPYWNVRWQKNILQIWAGINDFHNHPTMVAADLETGLQTYVAARKAAALALGVTLKVIVVTITPCDPANGYITTGQQTERTNFNTWLRANWNTFADALCDLDGIAGLADPTNTANYSDGLHFTTLAYNTYIVPAMVAAINSL